MAVPESGNIAVLAEKPSVARDIARVLGATSRGDGYLHGNGYVVTWALGHLAALAQPHEEIKLLSSKCVEVGTFAVQDRMKKATGQTLRVANRLAADGKADEAIDVLEWNLKAGKKRIARSLLNRRRETDSEKNNVGLQELIQAMLKQLAE